jgi:hypothetical protein
LIECSGFASSAVANSMWNIAAAADPERTASAVNLKAHGW